MSRARRCTRHAMYPRCPACEMAREPVSGYPVLDVPLGTVEYLREAARAFAALGDEGAEQFVQWVSVDLRETVRHD